MDAESRNLGEKSSEMEDESASSTPYVIANSSPGRIGSSQTGYFFSAPASPVHFFLLKSTSIPATAVEDADEYEVSSTDIVCDDFEFEFSTRSMISADEIFLNGQILPLTALPSHPEDEGKLESPPPPPPPPSIEVMVRERDLRSRNRSVRRRTRSMSPVRNAPPLHWHDDVRDVDKRKEKEIAIDSAEIRPVSKKSEIEVEIPTESVSASSSRSSSSSSSRNSRRWIFLKDLLHRSKSEGSSSSDTGPSTTINKERNRISLPFFSKSKNQSHPRPPPPQQPAVKGKAGIKRRSSVHERHYAENRAQAEDLRKKTFLPYRQGGFVLGCLGFSSRSYGVMNGFARTLSSVASR